MDEASFFDNFVGEQKSENLDEKELAKIENEIIETKVVNVLISQRDGGS